MATTAAGEAPRRPRYPFPLLAPRRPWMEQSLARIAEQRFVVDLLQSQGAPGFTEEALQTINDHWEAATSAAKWRLRPGPAVERVVSHLDAVDSEILRLAPPAYVYGQLPGVLADIKRQLPMNDPRVQRVTQLVVSPDATLSDRDRDLIAATRRAASAEARRQVRRLSSFTRVLYATAGVLAAGAIAFAVVGFVGPRNLPVCFNPVDGVVCPTSMTPTPGSQDSGTSTPFTVPLALAVLKLPTGALTAILGLLLMRGGFIPGLGALDTPAQIIAWAIVLGYSQQLLTQFVDRHAQSELTNFGRSDVVRKQDELVAAGVLERPDEQSTPTPPASA